MPSKLWLSRSMAASLALCMATGCAPQLINRTPAPKLPSLYAGASMGPDTASAARQSWEAFFGDPNLAALIGQALQNNQELHITQLEIEIARQEIRARKGEYLPSVGLLGAAGLEKLPRYTVLGASEAATQIAPGRSAPDPTPNYLAGTRASWELDVWRKLRNARKAASYRYLASVEGRNFLVTNLVAEIAGTYYELLALDNQLALVRQNIQLQTNALASVRAQKEAARVTELAVRRFEAQVLKTRSLQYDIQQRIVMAENRLNFLAGRYPQPIARTTQAFNQAASDSVAVGLPAQLLVNRPDVRQAEAELAAAKLDVRVARARFLPLVSVDGLMGLQAFQLSYFFTAPESIVLSLAGGISAPLINRNALYAGFYSADARQQQAIVRYERTVLNAYLEVANQQALARNLSQSYALRSRQVEALTESGAIANNLFNAARADYVEVLLTQRDALESSFELVETRLQQLEARVSLYRALGGGWR